MSTTVEYASFLIRLWREASTDVTVPAVNWQSQVEHIQTGQCWTFSTVDELLDFLRRQAEDPELLERLAGE